MELILKVEDVAKVLGISSSTVKKYYLLFEEEGYQFKRNKDGHVLFTENDLELFKEFMILKNQKGMTVPKAIKQLAQGDAMPVMTDMSVITVMSEQVMAVMMEVKELKALVKTQEDYIKESLEKRDQLLMASIRESQERKKEAMELEELKRLMVEQMQATKEIASALGKKPWWKFWK